MEGSATKRRRMNGMEATGELVSEGEAGVGKERVLTEGGRLPDIGAQSTGDGETSVQK